MVMKSFINKFAIRKLFGYRDIDISFDSSVMILVGENGFGKTTILNILYNILNLDFSKLFKTKFDSVSVVFSNGKEYNFSLELLKTYERYQKNKKENKNGMLEYIEKNLTGEMCSILFSLTVEKEKFKEYVENIELLKGVPTDFLYQMISAEVRTRETIKDVIDFVKYMQSGGFKILYYPTFRRIETDVANILKKASEYERLPRRMIDSVIWDNTVIRFGMEDVEKRIQDILEEIKRTSLTGFARISGEMISRLLITSEKLDDIHDFKLDEITIVLGRIGNNMSEEDKSRILKEIKSDSSLANHNYYLRYFLNQLLQMYNSQKKYDMAIKNFVSTCNRYLVNKQFVYNESDVDLSIQRNRNQNEQDNIKLKNLSSGEKQIVSIFSQLYLEPNKKYIILFDEPELSLSLYWQEKLLPDILDIGNCHFMFSVTHSPFIFNNKLKQYTHAASEFVQQ